MATIGRLLGPGGPLIDVTVPLGHENQKRWIYGFPEFVTWLQEVPHLPRGRLNAGDPPYEQLDNLLYRWTAGKDMRYGRTFKDLMPKEDEVWEMKTADIRIFGWMFRPVKFIAVFGDYADLYKPPRPTASYAKAINKVVSARNYLDLDQPKLATGTFDDLVCV